MVSISQAREWLGIPYGAISASTLLPACPQNRAVQGLAPVIAAASTSGLASVDEAQGEQKVQWRRATPAKQTFGLTKQGLQSGFGTMLDLLDAETRGLFGANAFIQAKLG